MNASESEMNAIHEILMRVWSREYSADDGLDGIESLLISGEPDNKKLLINALARFISNSSVQALVPTECEEAEALIERLTRPNSEASL